MISDSIYLQGKHFSNPELSCQDYALDLEKEDESGIIVVSDGCSSTSHSDLGARILSHLAATEIKNNQPIGPHLIFKAHQSLLSLGFTKKEDIFEALCTTLLIAEEKENEIAIHTWGDGTICAQYEDYFHAINIEYLINAPYYLVYDAFPEFKKEYQTSYPKNKKLISALKFKVKDCDKFISSTSFCYDYLEVLESNNLETSYDCDFSSFFPKNGLQKILLMSDGLRSFQSFIDGKYQEIIWERIMIQILNSWEKNFYGSLTKRMVSLKNKWEELGWVMNDDLAVGCLMRKK
jgi:hypothetical protein